MHGLSKVFGFTARELDSVMHRLEVPDAIADGLSEYDRQQLGDCISAIASGNWEVANSINSEMAHDIMRDCIEGSTWIAVHDNDGIAQRAVAGRKVLRGAANKINALIGGHRLDIPRC